MDAVPGGRVASLDLIRGVAIMGILAINIAGFAGPAASVVNPNLPEPGRFADLVAYGVKFVLFEGKMRALFTLLFGASLVLFVERADANGQSGDRLQLRRLFWLALFGLLHFYFIWWGDILFLYAACGLVALLMRELPLRLLTAFALTLIALWHLAGAALDAPDVIAEQHVAQGIASPAQVEEYDALLEQAELTIEEEIAIARGSFVARASNQLGAETFQPLDGVASSFGETLPLMLLGIVLYRTGFFAQMWPRRRMIALGLSATLAGLGLTLAILGWAWSRDFPPRAMESAFITWLAIPHLLMASGYAALLVLATPKLSQSALGRRISAAGRTAFSNYIGTSLVMTAIFYGWGLGLFGAIGHGAQWVYVALGWVLMLAWSEAWLKRFRQGPLEWAWRSLTENRRQPFLL